VRAKPLPVENDRRYASLADAARYLSCHPITIRQMIADGKLTMYRSGKKLVRIDLNQLDRVMERGE
jgi:excisionase family DNA binding protein